MQFSLIIQSFLPHVLEFGPFFPRVMLSNMWEAHDLDDSYDYLCDTPYTRLNKLNHFSMLGYISEFGSTKRIYGHL